MIETKRYVALSQKRPLKPKEVWAIRVRLQLEERRRDLALFNLALDSKLRGCDLVRLQVSDVCVGGRVRDRATVVQRKTGRPVQFEITEVWKIEGRVRRVGSCVVLPYVVQEMSEDAKCG
jgi:hypothetical protein